MTTFQRVLLINVGAIMGVKHSINLKLHLFSVRFSISAIILDSPPDYTEAA